VVLAERPVRQRDGIAGVRLALDVPKDLTSSVVDADDARRVESFSPEKTQERMYGRSPGSGSSTHGVADADGVVEIPAERLLLGHRRKSLGELDVVEGLRGAEIPG
jgi:hypothetical protein